MKRGDIVQRNRYKTGGMGMKEVKEFGLLVDGSMSIVRAGEFNEEIREVEQPLGEYGIIWLECLINNKVVVKYNAKFVAYIFYKKGGLI